MKQKANVDYGVIQAEYWMTQGIFISFASVFLLNAGFGVKTVGIVSCLGNLLTLFVQVWLARYADKNRQTDLTVIMRSVKYAVLLCVVPLLFLYRSSSIWTMLFFTLALAGHSSLLPLLNELCYRLENAGFQVNFGLCRAVGSLGYSILSIVLGYLTDGYGAIMVPICAIVILLLSIVSLKLLQKRTGGKETESPAVQKVQAKGGFIAYIRHNKAVFLTNVGAVLLIYSTMAFGTYMQQILSPLGGGVAVVGGANALSAIFEIPAMALFSVFARKWSNVHILKYSTIGFVLRAALFFAAGSVGMIFLGQSMQFFGYALFYPAMVAYVHEQSDEDEAATAQSLFSMATAVSTLAAALSGGVIIDAFGVKAMLAVCLMLSVLGSLLVWVSVNGRKACTAAENCRQAESVQ